MYFKNRAEAGRKLAEKLEKYKSQHIVVVALGLGSSIVAAQIAMKLHANLLLYIIKDINLPGEKEALAGLGSGDVFTFSHEFSTGELDELEAEYHSYIEQQKFEKVRELHALLGEEGEIKKDLLRHRVVILVADGLANGFPLDVAQEFMKTVAIKRLVIVVPVASVPAVDHMHLIGDEICSLSVTDNYLGANHYYDDAYTPKLPEVIKIMRNISMNWDAPLTLENRKY